MKNKYSGIKSVITLLAVAMVIYIIKESEKVNLLDTFLPEKIAIFKNVHMSGIEGSSEAWEIYAKEAWTGRDKFVTTFDFVTNASIDKDGRPLVRDLRARRLRIAKNKDVEIIKKVDNDVSRESLNASIDFGAISKSTKKEKSFSTLTADYIKFNPNSKKAVVQGKIKIVKNRLITRAEKISLDLDMNIATFESRSTFIKDNSELQTNTAVAYFDVDKIDMAGSVEVFQKNKNVHADRASYDDNAKTILMSSKVRAEIEKLKNVIKEESAEKYKDDESKQALTAKTILTCDNLLIYTEKNDASASGSVYVYQQNKEAKSDRAEYSENNETIVMTGNVSMKRKDSWVKADKIIVSVDKETFDAIGGVETTFKVKKGSKRL